MNIQQSDNGKSGSFYIMENNKVIGIITYEHSINNTIIIDHAEVDPSIRNKGIGNKLVQKGIEYAREKKLKIIPACPFVKIIMKRNPQYADVLY